MKEAAKVYVLRESDIWSIDAVLMGLRTALNAIVVSRGVDPTAAPARPSEVSRFDRTVDQILQERECDITHQPDLF